MKKALSAGLILLSLSIFVSAQTPDSPAGPKEAPAVSRVKDGFYLGVGLPFNQIHGDFDGASYLASDDEAFLVPKLGDSQGLKFFGGFRAGGYALEVSYAKSTHTATWDGSPISAAGAEFTVWSLHFKGYLGGSRSFIQPYILGGFGLPQILVKDGAIKGSTIGAAKFTGEELDLGVGLAIFPISRLCLFGEYTYRYIDIRGVSQPGGQDWRLADTWGTGLDASKMNLSLGVSFTF